MAGSTPCGEAPRGLYREGPRASHDTSWKIAQRGMPDPSSDQSMLTQSGCRLPCMLERHSEAMRVRVMLRVRGYGHGGIYGHGKVCKPGRVHSTTITTTRHQARPSLIL